MNTKTNIVAVNSGQTEREALLPCPFCGDKAEYKHNSLHGDESMAVCRCCGAQAFWSKWQARAMLASKPAVPVQDEIADGELIADLIEQNRTLRARLAAPASPSGEGAAEQAAAPMADATDARYIVIGYGESDYPQAAFANDQDELLDAVLSMIYTKPSDACDETREEYRRDLADEDEWCGKVWRTEFEIGGIVVYDLGYGTALPRASEQADEAVTLSAEQERWVHVDEVKQLCRDFSSRTGSVYIKDVESALDGLAAQPLFAIEVLRAIVHARDSGQEPSLILDENSPLIDAAREALKEN